MAFHFHAAVLHGHHHLRAQVLVMVHGRHWEITFFVTRTIAEIVVFTAGITAYFFRIDEIETVLLPLIETNLVTDEELGFSAKARRVGQPRGRPVKPSLLRNLTRVTIV